MNGPERLGDLLPGVVAALTLSHTRNGAPMPKFREDEIGTYVVDFEPGLYGPFKTRSEAREWAHQQITRYGNPDVTYSFVVAPVGGTDEIPAAVAA